MQFANSKHEDKLEYLRENIRGIVTPFFSYPPVVRKQKVLITST